jgi:hypothetical protein
MTTPDDLLARNAPLFGDDGVYLAHTLSLEAFRPVWESTRTHYANGASSNMECNQVWPRLLAIIGSPGTCCFAFEEAHVLRGLREALSVWGMDMDTDHRVCLDKIASDPVIPVVATAELLMDHNFPSSKAVQSSKSGTRRFHLVIALGMAFQYNLPLLAAMGRCLFTPIAMDPLDLREWARHVAIGSTVIEMHGSSHPSRLFDITAAGTLYNLRAPSHAHTATLFSKRRKKYERYRDAHAERHYRFNLSVIDGLCAMQTWTKNLGECPVCLDRPALVQCVPCGHHLCVDCVRQLDKCPLCRANVEAHQEEKAPLLDFAEHVQPRQGKKHQMKKKKKKKKRT